jgi:hypothetical protein
MLDCRNCDDVGCERCAPDADTECPRCGYWYGALVDGTHPCVGGALVGAGGEQEEGQAMDEAGTGTGGAMGVWVGGWRMCDTGPKRCGAVAQVLTEDLETLCVECCQDRGAEVREWIEA